MPSFFVLFLGGGEAIWNNVRERQKLWGIFMQTHNIFQPPNEIIERYICEDDYFKAEARKCLFI